MGWDLCYLYTRILFQWQILNCSFTLPLFFILISEIMIFMQHLLNKQHSKNSKTPETTAVPAALLWKRDDNHSFYLTVLSFTTVNNQRTTTTVIEKIIFVSSPLEKQKKERGICGLTKHTQSCKASLQHKEALIANTDGVTSRAESPLIINRHSSHLSGKRGTNRIMQTHCPHWFMLTEEETKKITSISP